MPRVTDLARARKQRRRKIGKTLPRVLSGTLPGYMDTPTQRRLAERVRRSLTAKLRAYGFVRTKTTFWVRPRDHVLEFVHLHIYRFRSVFRAHCGIRVLNDTFEAEALNGPTSQESWSNGHPTYALEFSRDEESIGACANEIDRFCSEVAEPWFRRFAEPRLLLATDSPLNERERMRLQAALEGSADRRAVLASRKLFGVP
jgi:hypothetical protein